MLLGRFKWPSGKEDPIGCHAIWMSLGKGLWLAFHISRALSGRNTHSWRCIQTCIARPPQVQLESLQCHNLHIVLVHYLYQLKYLRHNNAPANAFRVVSAFPECCRRMCYTENYGLRIYPLLQPGSPLPPPAKVNTPGSRAPQSSRWRRSWKVYRSHWKCR